MENFIVCAVKTTCQIIKNETVFSFERFVFSDLDPDYAPYRTI